MYLDFNSVVVRSTHILLLFNASLLDHLILPGSNKLKQFLSCLLSLGLDSLEIIIWIVCSKYIDRGLIFIYIYYQPILTQINIFQNMAPMIFYSSFLVFLVSCQTCGCIILFYVLLWLLLVGPEYLFFYPSLKISKKNITALYFSLANSGYLYSIWNIIIDKTDASFCFIIHYQSFIFFCKSQDLNHLWSNKGCCPF